MVAASAPSIALEEVHGVSVRAGQVTALTVQAHQGAIVEGRVLDPEGDPVAGASVAMVYLDISRVLFSADGRSEPLVTDAEGRFRLEHVAAGRVAVVAAADDVAPSNIEELAVVDGGVYDDVMLQLGVGAAVTGVVVDDYVRKLQKTADDGPASVLTPKEREVLQLLAEGNSTKQIAAALHVSAKTIETHRQNIMNKLEIRSVAELTKFAIREGLTSLDT